MFKNSRGATLIEIIVVVFLVTLFSIFLIVDFPRIERQFALSRAGHRMAQDLRRAEDLGFSGVTSIESMPPAKGFGIYINLNNPQSYILYGDTAEPYNVYTSQDFIIESIDLSSKTEGIYVKGLENASGSEENKWTSINFSPPNPTVSIENLNAGWKYVGIVLGIQADPSLSKEINVNLSGLIEIK